MRKFLLAATLASVLMLTLGAMAFAADPTPGQPGQPGQSCQSQPASPGGGNSSVSNGSPFQGASSAGVYANGPGTGGPGTPTGTGHITNSNAVSQYDVACFQVSQPHP